MSQSIKNPYAKILNLMRKEGKKDNPPSVILAKVTQPPPDLVIKYNEIELDKDNILISSYLLQDYQRNFEIVEGTGEEEVESKFTFDIEDGTFQGDTTEENANIKLVSATTPTGDITGVTPATITTTMGGTFTAQDSGHKHDINSFKTENNKFTAKGTFKFTDTLKKGDLLAVMPMEDWQTFIVLDKVVSLKDA